MDDCLSAGPLFGRPFGGTAILVKNTLAAVTISLMCPERFIAALVADWLIINVYMPCVGTNNRTFLYSDTMQEIGLQQLINDYSDYNCLIGGDFYVDLDSTSNISLMVNICSFIGNNSLGRGDIHVMYPTSDKFTYQNE